MQIGWRIGCDKMSVFDTAWPIALSFSLVASLLITVRTTKAKQKGRKSDSRTVLSALGATVARALGFFVILILPLIDQPRVSGGVFLQMAGAGIVAAGIATVVCASLELMKTRFEYHGIGTPEKLIKTEPYRIMRHPANVGFIAAFAGWSLYWSALYAIMAIPILTVLLVIESFAEERNLERKFGDEYRKYKESVGMFFPK